MAKNTWIALTAILLYGCTAHGDQGGPLDQTGDAGAPSGSEGPAGQAVEAGPVAPSAFAAATQVINAAPGPFPVSGTFTSTGGTLVLFVDGSGFSGSGPGSIGTDVSIDGVQRGISRGYVNEENSHQAFVSNMLVVTGISAGSHTVTLTAFGPTQADTNDFFSVGVLEYR